MFEYLFPTAVTLMLLYFLYKPVWVAKAEARQSQRRTYPSAVPYPNQKKHRLPEYDVTESFYHTVLPEQLRKEIINSLKRVDPTPFAGFCIQAFVSVQDTKTDDELVELITDLQKQIKDNPAPMKRILGAEFDYLKNLRIDGSHND